MKKQPFEAKYTRKYSNSSNMSDKLKIDFFWRDDEMQFLDSWANSNFGCYFGRSALLI